MTTSSLHHIKDSVHFYARERKMKVTLTWAWHGAFLKSQEILLYHRFVTITGMYATKHYVDIAVGFCIFKIMKVKVEEEENSVEELLHCKASPELFQRFKNSARIHKFKYHW